MDKLLSIIVAADSATAEDLSIPLSSINNQLGIDFRQVEVILIDNGRYQLDSLEPLRLFNHLKFRYIKPAQIWAWEVALQQGLTMATGKFVLFMGPNMQLNQVDVLQRFFVAAQDNSAAQIIGGLLLTQQMTTTREVTYQVGSTTRRLCGRMLNRALLMRAQIAFEAYGDYTEELVARLAEAVAGTHQHEEPGIACAQFLGRTVSEAVMAPSPTVLTPDWVRMMTRYFERLKALTPEQYPTTLGRCVVRFYTQLQAVPGADREAMLALMADLVRQNAAQWAHVAAFIDELRVSDRSMEAPWNHAPKQFDAYLARLQAVVA
ncbi:glycosyltransferase [Lacticaseibacillus daqingensis]|uniref:glycosyltransferase n=1 Tax=Lacticaseibacillus daqingensis TaxID=2486014 RepID=UPI000F7675CD|nr:glycosyltransferase [Lacticaseibacillus daqingensis]